MLKTKKRLDAIIAIEIIITMTLYYFVFVGMTAVTYAIDVVKTNHANVEYEAYFENEKGEKLEKIEDNIDKEEYLYVDVTVKNEGYFNGEISLENNNFNIKEDKLSEEVEEIKDNKVKLKQINAGSTSTIKLAIEAKKDSKIKEESLSSKTEVNLGGSYVNSKNVEKEKYIEIKGKAKVEVKWTSKEDTKVELEGKLLTNSVYEVNGENKRLVQMVIGSKITDNNYPIKNTEISLNVPEKVKEVKVTARSVKGTNSGLEFGEGNYEYKKEENKLTIKVGNEDKENVSWEKGVEDTFVVTYVLNPNENIANEDIKITDKIKLYDEKEIEEEKDVHIEEEIDGVISSTIESSEDEIYKGKIYTGEERSYTETNKINVDYIEAGDKIEIEQKAGKYVAGEEEKEANIIYRETRINKEEMKKILGEEGSIIVKDQNGEMVAEINKDSETNEEGKVVITYPEDEKEIKLETSKPENIGTLNIENTKVIKDAGYGRDEIKNITKIREKTTVNTKVAEKEINLKETETEGKIDIDTNKISTVAENQTITVNATLEANDESKNLYKNPTVTVKLPKEMTLKTAQYAALYKNGLEVEDVRSSKNENGENEIHIKLKGEQEKYDVTGGTKICLKLDVVTNKLTPSKKSQIDMTYTNENGNEVKTTSADINFESQYGLMLYNRLIDFNNNEKVETIDQEPKKGFLEMNSNEKEAKLQTALINNYDEEIKNVVLIGKLPAKDENNTFKIGIKNIGTNKENAKVYYSNKIDASTDDESWGEANQDASSYKIEIDSIKPEEIVAISTDIVIPENLKSDENGVILSDVKYNLKETEQNNSSQIVLTTGSTAVKSETTVDKNIISAQSEEGIVVNIAASQANNVLADKDSIREGETIKYNIKVTNNTGKDYSNVKVRATQKNGNVWDYVEKTDQKHTDATNFEEVKRKYYEITSSNEIALGNIESLKNGESYEFEYKSSTYLLSNEKIDGNETYGNILISTEDGTLNENFVTTKNEIQSAKLQVDIKNSKNEEYIWYENGSYSATMNVRNISSESLNNIQAEMTLSKELSDSIDLDNYNFNYMASVVNENEEDDDDSRDNLEGIEFTRIEKKETGEAVIKFNITSLQAGESKNIAFMLSASNVDTETKAEYILATLITEDNQNYTSKFERDVYKNHRDLKISLTGTSNGNEVTEDSKLNNEDEVEFLATIENKDTKKSKMQIIYNLDTTLDIKNASINSSNDVISDFSNNTLELRDIELEPGQKMKIEVTAKVNGFDTDKTESTISAYDNGTATNVSANLSFGVNRVEPENPDKPDPEKPDPEKPDPDKPEPDNSGNTNNTNNTNTNNTTQNNTNNTNTSNTTQNNAGSNTNGNNNGNNNSGNQNTNENKKYVVKGTAWLDENKDGKKSSNEKKIAKVQVSAINTINNQVSDTVSTDSNGEYSLKLSKGKYIFIFKYDNSLYKATTYKVKGASDEECSYVVEGEYTLNGQKITGGATDEITLDGDLSNLNIGLISKNTFDLQIQKSVSKIIVKNSAGTKTYEQKDGTELAKAEIKSKYLKDSLVVIEYKMKITNAGSVAGYAKNIEDNLPATLTFSSEMNKDWYKSGTKIYNTSLANTLIKPGESKEVTLVLTKTMTESNTGLINNKASISVSSNVDGMEDKNNNDSQANVIISVSTGALVSYIAVVLGLFGILGISAYMFVRNVKKK